jgi:Xaa-Pro dipeptidase
MDRRRFMTGSVGFIGTSALGCATPRSEGVGVGTGTAGTTGRAAEAAAREAETPVPEAIRALRPMTQGIVPISDDERRARMEKARRLMVDHGMEAVFIEPGTTMNYFTGVRWGTSERMFAMVLPARGEPAFICPAFEEARAREVVRFSNDIRLWQEDENPGALVVQVLRDRGLATRRIGIEERARFFLMDSIRRAAPQAEYVLADPVTAGCRMIKSPAELALMQRANDITHAAFKAAFTTMTEGMSQNDLRRQIGAAYTALGVTAAATPQFGKYTAYPHGSNTPQRLKEGDVVLVDGGCTIEGYQSDITRTTVFGKPSARQTEVWNLEKRAQEAALAACKVGVPCEAVDAAARKVITDAGFGPDYKVPGLPHRTGHGIGMDGHEWTNLVRGNKTPLAPGMCFSDEPMIAIYGEFGIRLEDCFYMTEAGPHLFTPLSPSIDRPCA